METKIILHIVDRNDKKAFQNLIPDPNALIDLLKNLGEVRQCVINYFTRNPDEFYRLVRGRMEIVAIIKAFPDFTESFFKLFMKNALKYHRPSTERFGLDSLGKSFPKYASIFKHIAVEDGLKKLIETRNGMELKKNARILGQGHRDKHCNFSRLPPEA